MPGHVARNQIHMIASIPAHLEMCLLYSFFCIVISRDTIGIDSDQIATRFSLMFSFSNAVFIS